MSNRKNLEIYIRNFVFGMEDSLVSTVGLLSGIAVAGVSKTEILLTGFVLIFVEAFAMATGSFLSEHTVEEYEEKKEVSPIQPMIGAGVMFLSYICAGLIPIFPYMILDEWTAFPVSIVASLVGLFLLGAVSSKLFKLKIKSAFEMLFLGGVAVLVGVAIGKIFNKA